MGINIKEFVETCKNISKYDSAFNETCVKFSEDIHADRLEICNIVEELGPLLTDKSPAQREIGTLILSKIIENLPSSVLTVTQLSFISSFYADRLKDNHQVIPAVLQGILAVTKCNNLPSDAVPQLLNSMFENIPCQQQQRPDRLNIYLIYQNLLINKESALKAMGLNFMLGVISAIDGERDPQNLLHLFNWLPKLLKTIQLGQLAEDMFDVIACYFPVDFKMPSTKTEIENISRDVLATALAPCLCGVSEFGEHCLPLILEKLSSSLAIAKLDSLNLLTESCATFNREIYISHSTDIFTQIINELNNCKDEELEKAARRCLTAFTKKITQNCASDDADQITNILNEMTSKVKDGLRPDDSNRFDQSSKILQAISCGSTFSCAHVTKLILPLLVNQFNMTRSASHQVVLFSALIKFVQIYTELNDLVNLNDEENLNVVPNLCLNAIQNDDLHLRAVGLESLMLLAKILPAEIRKCVYSCFTTMLVIYQPPYVRQNLLNCFKTLATLYPDEILDVLLPSVVTNDLLSLKLYLDALVTIATIPKCFDIVLPRLCNYCTKDVPTATVALESFILLLENNIGNRNLFDYLYVEKKFVKSLIDWSTNVDDIALNVADNETLLLNLSNIIALLVRNQNSGVQETILNEEIINVYDRIKAECNNTVDIFLINGLLTNIRQDVCVPQKEDIIKQFVVIVLKSNFDCERTLMVQLLANLLNKTNNEVTLQESLSFIEKQVDFVISNNINVEPLLSAVSLVGWTTKALILRQHSSMEKWIDRMLQMLGKHESAVYNFKLVMHDESKCLVTTNFCTVKLLYKQKLFSIVCDKLLKFYKIDENLYYLLAFGYLFQETPVQIILIHFKKIIQLVILSLDNCQDGEVLSSMTHKLGHFIQSNKLLMVEYIQEFLPRFLKLAFFKSSLKVRSASLQCIQYYTNDYPIYRLLPLKQTVIQALGACLDDPKRVVRKEAVIARNCWFLLDAPT